MFICIYRLPVLKKQYFSENLSMIANHYLSIWDSHKILEDFNMEPDSPILISFMQYLNLFNIIKSNACFKGNSCIDLILTNRKYCFKHSSTFETVLRDHHHLIYSVLKATFKKEEPKLYKCRTAFQVNLQNRHEEGPKVHQNFEETFVKVLAAHTSRNTKILCGNHKPHVDENLKKEDKKNNKKIL